MRTKIAILIAVAWLCGLSSWSHTLEQCRQAAAQNLPIVKRYGLIERDRQFTLERVSTAWLPSVSASAQATLQSAVATLPETLSQVLTNSGSEVKGLSKGQYRVGVDVNQMVYDGGSVRARREVAQRQADVDRAQVDVDIYRVYARVDELYFCLLLLDRQIALAGELHTLLLSNEQKLESMARHGTAADCDYQSVQAERLSAAQQIADLQAQRETARRLLSLLCGVEVVTVDQPPLPSPGGGQCRRPELALADSRLRLADALRQQADARLRPTVSLFGTAFVGYPGYDMFHDMLHRSPTVNALIGARVSWNIGALYTRKSDLGKIAILRDRADLEKEYFLFENDMDRRRLQDDVARYNEQIVADAQIIALREQVRRASESKLAHGIIAVNDLVRDIFQENAARNQQAVHQIQALHSMYNLQLSTNQPL